jgi:hypothetical protein
MRGRVILRIALLVIVGALGLGASVALGWDGSSGNGQVNGWTNKQDRGCPTDYVPISATVAPYVDLNGDGVICEKPVGTGDRVNDVDNQSNH